MGGEFAYPKMYYPTWDPIGFDPQPFELEIAPNGGPVYGLHEAS